MKLYSLLVVSFSFTLMMGMGCKKNKESLPVKIGDFYQGGYVFYIDNTGKHGMVLAPPETEKKLVWGCDGVQTGNPETAIGTGQYNTNTIVFNCRSNEVYAAAYCDMLVCNNYSDWFLPSWSEMKEAVVQLKDNKDAAITENSYYFTSSEGVANVILDHAAIVIVGLPETTAYYPKKAPENVRAARAF